jgi:hypothetical protein
MAAKDHSDKTGTPFPYNTEQDSLRHLIKLLQGSEGTAGKFIEFWTGVLNAVGETGEASRKNGTPPRLRAV